MQFQIWGGLNTYRDTKSVAASGNNLCALRDENFIFRYLGPTSPTGWERIDDTPSTAAVVTDGDMIYKLHSDGNVYWYDPLQTPPWQQLGNDEDTVAIAASDGSLTSLTKDGSIYLFTGTPLNWLKLDDNAATVAIVAAGGHLYQLHSGGSIFEYNGTPLTGWLSLDTQPATVAIAAGGDDLYQLHNDGSVWQFNRDAGSTWTMIGDPNGFVTFAIVAGNGIVVQMQNDENNDAYMYTGTPRSGWLWINSDGQPYRAVAIGVPQPVFDGTSGTPTGIYVVDGNGNLTEYLGLQNL